MLPYKAFSGHLATWLNILLSDAFQLHKIIDIKIGPVALRGVSLYDKTALFQSKCVINVSLYLGKISFSDNVVSVTIFIP